jgi:hypothetical protein
MTARYMVESGKWDKRTNYEMKLERDRRQEEELNSAAPYSYALTQHE